jgi:hypothetical protein
VSPARDLGRDVLNNWKAKFGGMDVSDAKRLKTLEDENARLKKLLAEQMLDAAALRELLLRKWYGPPKSSLRRLRKLVCCAKPSRICRPRRACRSGGRRHLALRPAGGARTDRSGREARQARHDRLRSRHRVRLERDPRLGDRLAAAQPRPAPPRARCSPRAHHRIRNGGDSSRGWMKIRWQVNSFRGKRGGIQRSGAMHGVAARVYLSPMPWRF